MYIGKCQFGQVGYCRHTFRPVDAGRRNLVVTERQHIQLVQASGQPTPRGLLDLAGSGVVCPVQSRLEEIRIAIVQLALGQSTGLAIEAADPLEPTDYTCIDLGFCTLQFVLTGPILQEFFHFLADDFIDFVQ